MTIAFDWNNAFLAFIAVMNAITAAMVYFNNKANQKMAIVQAAEAAAQRTRSEDNAKNIQKIELATNSMKDALVKATGEASLAEGRELGRAEGEKASPAFPAGPTKVETVTVEAETATVHAKKVE